MSRNFTKKQKCQPYGGDKGKVSGLHPLRTMNFTEVHPAVVEIFPSGPKWWSDWQTELSTVNILPVLFLKICHGALIYHHYTSEYNYLLVCSILLERGMFCYPLWCHFTATCWMHPVTIILMSNMRQSMWLMNPVNGHHTLCVLQIGSIKGHKESLLAE